MQRETVLKQRAKVLLVGGQDVDARIELMRVLETHFDLAAVGTSSNIQKHFELAGFPYRFVRMERGVNPASDLLYIKQLLSIFRVEQPALVHTFDTKPCALGRIAACLAGIPVIVGTLPGLGSLYSSKNKPMYKVVRTIYEQLQKLACHLSHITIFQNQDDAMEFITRTIVPPEKVRIIPGSGVRTDVFSPEQISNEQIATLRAELGIMSSDLVVTMISRVIRPKGVLDFAKAASIVRRNKHNMHFVLVGPDDQESPDRLDAEEMEDLKRQVTWIGARQDVAVVLAASDIFVLPTFYREGIPRVLLEAASMGLPLVASMSPGCSEVVHDGVNGFLVPPHNSELLAEAIWHLAEDKDLRERFGIFSREIATKRFDLFIIAREIACLYESLLKSTSSFSCRGGDEHR